MVSGGVDVSVFAAQAGPDGATGTFDSLIEIEQRVERLACPTVFAAHALCLTWAFELSLACDLIVAAQSASFGLVEIVVGLTPAMGGTQRLAERAGSGRAREFVMTGRPYDAATLERWNVVNRVFPDKGFDRAARELAADSGDGPHPSARRDQASDPRVPRGRGAAGRRTRRAHRWRAVRDRGSAAGCQRLFGPGSGEGEVHGTLIGFRRSFRGRGPADHIARGVNANGYRQVVQRRQGIRLHHA